MDRPLRLAQRASSQRPASQRRQRHTVSLIAAAAAMTLAGSQASAQLKVDNTGTPVDVWLVANNWVGDALPTGADDVVFDNSAATLGAIFSINSTNAAGDIAANSITFGSANGTALAAFTLQGDPVGNTTRALALTTGAITAHSSVTGTQTIASSLITGAITLSAGDNSYELTNNSTAGELAIQGVLSGVGATVYATGVAGSTVRISGANTYTGATIVDGNRLIIADAGTFNNTASISILNGGTLTVGANNSTLKNLTAVPAGTFLQYGGGTQASLTNADAPPTIFGTVLLLNDPGTGYDVTFAAGSLVAGSSGNRQWSGVGRHLLLGDMAIANNQAVGVITVGKAVTTDTAGLKTLELTGDYASALGGVTGIISDGAGQIAIVKTGPGYWALSNNSNSFTGGVTVKEGQLRANEEFSFGNSTVNVLLGDTTGSADATISFANGATTFTNPIVVQAGSTGKAFLRAANTSGITISSAITLNKPLTFTHVNNSGWTFNGPFTLNGNSLHFEGTGNPSPSAGTTIATVLSGAGGTISLDNTGGGVLHVALNADNAGLSYDIDVNYGTLRTGAFANPFGTGPISMSNGTELNFQPGNHYTYSHGAINIEPSATATFRAGSTSGRVYRLGQFNLGAAGVGATARFVLGSNSNNHGMHVNGFHMLGDSTANVDITVNASPVNLQGGVTDDGNARSFTKDGPGILFLSASNAATGTLPAGQLATAGTASTYGGNTFVNAGILRLGMTNALPTGTTVDVASGALLELSVGGMTTVTAATFDLEIAGLTGAGTVRGNNNNTANNATIGNRTLTLSGAGSYGFSGLIENKNPVNATANNVLSLLKKGVGTQTLSGSNTYTGLTTVEDGTLAVAGSHDSNHGGYSVTGGTLQVSGAISATGTPAAVSATGAGVVSITGTGSLRASTVSSVAGLVNDGTLLPVTSATLAGLSGTGTTTLDGAATLSATHIRQGTLNVNDTAVASVDTNGSDTGTSVIGTLNIAAGAKLDVKDNDLVVTGMSAAAVRSLLVTGFNSGDWAGNGLTSSAAQNDPTFYTALGYADNAELGYATFSGQSVSGTDILVKYTFYGDTDLNGVVDSDDLTNWIDGFNGVGSQVWLYGDFDYSGVVDSDDLTLWVDGFLNTVGPLSASLQAEFSAALASGLASGDFSALQAVASSIVPEPASLSLLTLGALALRRRRR